MKTTQKVKFSPENPLKLELESRKVLAASYIKRRARKLQLNEEQIGKAIYCAERYLECGHSMHRALVTACGGWNFELPQ